MTALDVSYTHDKNARILTITDNAVSGQNRTFTYDAVGRVKTAAGPWGAGSYLYDSLGNIRKKTLGSRVVTIEYNLDGQVARAKDTDDGSVWRDYDHDPRGNVTDNDRLTFTYDLAMQPTSAGGGASGTFEYDGNFKRVKQTIDGKTIYSVYSLSGVLLYRDNTTDSETTDYVKAAGKTIARLKDDQTTVEVAYLHQDHLGSPAASTNASGSAVSWREDYTPYGEERQDPAGNDDDESFTGHVRDDALGLVYMQARYQDPVIGRFLSPDPVQFRLDRPQMFNRYSYANNDPVNAVDPDGRNPLYGMNAQGNPTAAAQGCPGCGLKTAVTAATIATIVIPGPEDILIAGALAKLSTGEKGVSISLKMKDTWTDVQKSQAVQKVEKLDAAAKKGDLKVVKNPERTSTSAGQRYRKAGNDVPTGNDVDHVQDLQLGGKDSLDNMAPLDSSVNRSLGAQIQHQIKDAPAGAKVCSVEIGC